MPIYASTEQLYQCANLLFEQIQREDPKAADTFMAAKLVVRLQCTAPSGDIVLNGRTRPIATTFGPSSAKADLDITLTADTLHEILLGQLGIAKALGGGRLVVKGPIWKATALADLFRQGQTIYPKILKSQGIG